MAHRIVNSTKPTGKLTCRGLRSIPDYLRSDMGPRLRILAWVCAMAIAGVTAPLRAQPIITEIFYNPPGGSEIALEWVEIYNPGAAALEIAGMVVDSEGEGGIRERVWVVSEERRTDL